MKISFFVVFASLFLTHCTDKGEDKNTPTTTTGGETEDETPPDNAGSLAINIPLESLPNVTDPVVAYVATTDTPEAEEAASFNSLNIGNLSVSLIANSGVSLGKSASEVGAVFDANGKSKAGCRAINEAYKFFQDAGSTDSMQCMLRGTYGDSDTLWDGKDHIVNWGFGSQSYKIKLKINGSKTGISSLTMHACNSNRQTHYFAVAIDDYDVTLTSKREHPGGSSPSCSGDTSGFSKSVVTSKVNNEGKLVGLKKIATQSVTTCDASGDVARFTRRDITQSDNNFQLVGYSHDAGDINFAAFAELLDTNTDSSAYAITKLAIGDGAAMFSDISTAVEGWNGDSGDVDNNSSRIPKVEDLDQLDIPSSAPDIGFTGDEVWDCGGEAESTTELSQTIMQACSERFDIDQDPIDCE